MRTYPDPAPVHGRLPSPDPVSRTRLPSTDGPSPDPAPVPGRLLPIHGSRLLPCTARVISGSLQGSANRQPSMAAPTSGAGVMGSKAAPQAPAPAKRCSACNKFMALARGDSHTTCYSCRPCGVKQPCSICDGWSTDQWTLVTRFQEAAVAATAARKRVQKLRSPSADPHCSGDPSGGRTSCSPPPPPPPPRPGPPPEVTLAAPLTPRGRRPTRETVPGRRPRESRTRDSP